MAEARERGTVMAEETVRAVVALFEDEGAAKAAYDAAKEIGISEGIVLVRDADGKVHEHLANMPDVGSGAAVGASLGAIGAAIIAVAFPPAAVVEVLAAGLAGAVAGGLVGGGAVAAKDEILERRAFHDLAEELKPGERALIVVMAPEDATRFEAGITGAKRVWGETLPSQD